MRASGDVVRLLREEKRILDDVERELEVSIVLREDEMLPPARYEIAVL